MVLGKGGAAKRMVGGHGEGKISSCVLDKTR